MGLLRQDIQSEHVGTAILPSMFKYSNPPYGLDVADMLAAIPFTLCISLNLRYCLQPDDWHPK